MDSANIQNEIDKISPDFDFSDATSSEMNCQLFRLTKVTSMERPKRIIGSLWAQNENAFNFGEDGSCKSIFSTQAGCAIATGQSICPDLPNDLPAQPVCLFDVELSDYQFNSRYPEGVPDNLKRLTFSDDMAIVLAKASVEYVIQQIEAAANQYNSKIIILDNLSALMAMADLTKTTDSIQLMGHLNDLKKKGFSILIIDHCRKPMSNGSDFKTISKFDLQGSKMKTNLVDSVFSIGKSAQGDNIRYIKALKIRSFQMEFTSKDVATMELRTNPLRLEYLGRCFEFEHVNDNSGIASKMINEGKTQQEIAGVLGVSQQMVSKIIKSNV